MASAPIAADWTRLPTDVICLIFARLPRRPRHRIASLVCRRWRECTLRMVTCIDYSAPVSLFALPSVTSLTDTKHGMRLSPLPCAPPTWLRSIQYTAVKPLKGQNHCDLLAGLTGLTRIDLSLPEGICCKDSFALILRNAASLTDLTLSTEKCYGPLPFAKLACTPLPKLRSLDLRISANARLTRQLIRPHAQQLTRLVTYSSEVFAEDADDPPLVLPACTSLDLRFHVMLRQDAPVPDIAKAVPSLTSLSVSAVVSDSPPAIPSYTALTALALRPIRDSYGELGTPGWLRGSQFSALTLLDLSGLPLAVLNYLPRPVPMLRTLNLALLSWAHLTATHIASIKQYQCTQLTTLHVTGDILDALSKEEWRFPLLKKLIVIDAQPAHVAVVRVVVSHCRLRSLKLHLLGTHTHEAVVALMEDVTRSGAQKLRLTLNRAGVLHSLRSTLSAFPGLSVRLEAASFVY